MTSTPTTTTDEFAGGEVAAVDDRAAEPLPEARGLAHRWVLVRQTAEAGMSTAEYAVGTVAAVAFAAVLFKVVHSSAVQTALSHIITTALNVSL